MSDEIKIQTSSPDDLAGGKHPLQSDNEQSNTCGHTQNQNTLSFCRGTNVEPVAARTVSPAPGATARPAATVSGMAADSPLSVGTIKQVDSKESIVMRRRMAGWNDDFLLQVLGIKGS